MLKGIPAIITPKLMKIIMEMGHNDELVICDANFPKFAHPSKVVESLGTGTVEMLDAITTLMPLDNGAEEPVIRMAVSEGDSYVPSTWPKYAEITAKNEGREVPSKELRRDEFYKRASKAYAVVVTGEPTFYATLILKKGCVGNG